MWRGHEYHIDSVVFSCWYHHEVKILYMVNLCVYEDVEPIIVWVCEYNQGKSSFDANSLHMEAGSIGMARAEPDMILWVKTGLMLVCPGTSSAECSEVISMSVVVQTTTSRVKS